MKRLLSFFCGLAIFAAASTTHAQIDWAAGAPGGTSGGSIELGAGGGAFLTTGIASALVGGNVTDGGVSYTVSAWIKSSEDDGTGNARNERWWFGTHDAGLHIGINNGNTLTHDHWRSGNFGTTVVAVNTWVHTAYAYDATAGEVTIYRDGASEGTFSTTAPNISTTDLIIGSRNGTGEPGWGGCIDDVAIFTSVLSADDVARFV